MFKTTLLALFLFIGTAFSQTKQLTNFKVKDLPRANAYNGLSVQVIDGANSTDCSVGLGTFQVICTSNGTTWIGSSSSSGSGTVTTTGSPTSGNIAVFSGATSISAGTTTGSGAITLATSPTLSTPTLTNPNINKSTATCLGQAVGNSTNGFTPCVAYYATFGPLTAALSSTTAFTPSVSGAVYQISFGVIITTAGTSGTIQGLVTYGINTNITSYFFSPTCNTSSTNGAYCAASPAIEVQPSTLYPLQYSTIFNSVVGSPTYSGWVLIKRVW